MSKNINIARVLFWGVILTVTAFTVTGLLLGSNTPNLVSKADEAIKVNQEQISSPEGRIRLAIAYYEKYYETDEKSYLNNGIKLLDEIDHREFPVKNYLLGIFYLDKNEEELALKYLETYIQNNPMHVEALLAKGSALINLGKYQEAINYLKPLTKSQPEIADTFELMSGAYLKLGDKKQAEKLAHEAEKLLGTN